MPALRKNAGIAACLALVVTALATPASAGESESPDGLEILENVAPEVLSDTAEPIIDSVTEAGSVDVLIPSDPGDGIELSSPGLDDLTISLPFADQAELVGDATAAVYDNGNSSSTVPLVKDDGSVQVITTIADGSAPTTYAYLLGGAEGSTLRLTSDGGAEMVDEDGIVTVTVDAPWAVDANGATVATRYEINDDALVQVVEHDVRNTAYPVVADPKISMGWWYYLHFNRAETKTVSEMSGGAAAVTTLCTVAATPLSLPVAAALGASCGLQSFSIVYMAKLAQNSSPKKCLALRWRPLSGGIVYATTYKDSRCK